jgi:hypothetical protein
MTVNSTVDAIMDELFGEVEQSLHITSSPSESKAKPNDDKTLDLDELDLTPDEDVVWIAPYGAPPTTPPPPPSNGSQSAPEAAAKPEKSWLTPVFLVCACGSALLASVLWSFYLAHRLSQLDRPAPPAPVATAPQPEQPRYAKEISELLSFSPIPKTTATANPVAAPSSPDPAALPPPPLSPNPLPIPQTVYVPVYQPPVTALPPVEAAPPVPKETVVVPEKTYTLVGVLSFGDRSSAMFEFEGTVHSIALGKPVGNTGWILSKVQQRDVVLKRNNETKSLVVGQKL